MTIGFIGADHSRASLAVRDRLAVSGETLDHLLTLLHDDSGIAEAAVLSTCNRTEIYVAADDTRAALSRCVRYLLQVTGASRPDAAVLEPRLDDEAVRHLCAVASGLRSLALGETQILTQVREAFALAAQRGVAGTELQSLARVAVQCGKRVRSETTLGMADTSVSALAVEAAARRLGDLAGRAALLIGAGRINEVSAQLLRDAGIGSLTVVSRTREAADRLAASCGGRAAMIDDVPSLLSVVDVAIAATRAPDPVIIPQLVRPRDGHRPLLLFDIAVPRDIDPAVGRLDGVELVDMDGLRALAPAHGPGAVDGVAAAWAVVDECVARYRVDALTRRAVPLVARLRAHVDRNKEAELARALASLEHLDAADRDAVALMAHRLVNHMFHHLATRLKMVATLPDADIYLAALAFLFDEGGTEYRTMTAPALEQDAGDGEADIAQRPRPSVYTQGS